MLKVKHLEQIRKEKKFTQESLALAIGRTREWYGNMVKTGNLSLFDLKKICDVLEITPFEILNYERDETYLVSEGNINYFKKDIIKDLREQLKVKDEQIKFLQHIIEEKL